MPISIMKDFEHGDPLALLQSMPLMACYYMFYNMPNIAMTMLILMDQWHYYIERADYISPASGPVEEDESKIYAKQPREAKRADLVQTYTDENEKSSDGWVELRNSVNSRKNSRMGGHGHTFNSNAKANNLTSARGEFTQKVKEDMGVARKEQGSEFKAIWKTMPDKAHLTANIKIAELQRKTFRKAMDGELPHLKPKRAVQRGASMLPVVLKALEERTELWSQCGVWHTLKMDGLKTACDEYGVDATKAAGKLKRDIAELLHNSTPEGSGFEFLLRQAGKEIGVSEEEKVR